MNRSEAENVLRAAMGAPWRQLPDVPGRAGRVQNIVTGQVRPGLTFIDDAGAEQVTMLELCEGDEPARMMLPQTCKVYGPVQGGPALLDELHGPTPGGHTERGRA